MLSVIFSIYMIVIRYFIRYKNNHIKSFILVLEKASVLKRKWSVRVTLNTSNNNIKAFSVEMDAPDKNIPVSKLEVVCFTFSPNHSHFLFRFFVHFFFASLCCNFILSAAFSFHFAAFYGFHMTSFLVFLECGVFKLSEVVKTWTIQFTINATLFIYFIQCFFQDSLSSLSNWEVSWSFLFAPFS